MAKHMISIIVLISISFILLRSSCSAVQLDCQTAPWIVVIRQQSLLTGKVVHHCNGVLYSRDTVLTSKNCITSLPEHSQLIMYAGSHCLQRNVIQIFHAEAVLVKNNLATAVIKITSSAVSTNYVNRISPCGYQCEVNINEIGFQIFGSDTMVLPNYLDASEMNFSNSYDLCQKVNEDGYQKLCTQLNSRQCNANLGGEALMKVDKGRTILAGFWEYDNCTENIRVFERIDHVS